MDEGRVQVGQIEVAYESFGDPGARPMVLVMGLSTQMIAWPDDFCQSLADDDRYVIRFDNRDVGLSTHLHEYGEPDIARVALRRRPPPYTMTDMARDTLGLADALNLREFDLVGASMGGFIAQTAALLAPHRLRSLGLIMTSTGSMAPWVGKPSVRLMPHLLGPPRGSSAEDASDAVVETFRRIGSPGFPMDEVELRSLAQRSVERGFDPAGAVRQLAAIVAQPNRTRALRRLDIPTTVIHGLADPLVAPSGGLALARAIPRATFVGYAGMGHDLPRPLLTPMRQVLAANARL